MEEITQTIIDVNSVLDALGAAGKNLPSLTEAQDLPRLASALGDFRNTLAKLKEQNTIVKFLTSNRLRKKIEESNSQGTMLLLLVIIPRDPGRVILSACRSDLLLQAYGERQ